MAKKTTTKETALAVDAAVLAVDAAVLAEEVAPSCPVFMLRADNPRHLHALVAAAAHLAPEERGEVELLIREFELHGEARG